MVATDPGPSDESDATAHGPAAGRAGGRGRLAHVVPARAQTFGMAVFLATLTVLFGATMLLYVYLRFRAQEPYPLGSLRGVLTNAKLYLSTAIVLAASLTVHMALLRIRRERHRAFFRWLMATNALAVAFLLIQTPAMIQIVTARLPAPATGSSVEPAGAAPQPAAADPASQAGRVTQLYKLVFLLVLLHALHVVGGVVYLITVTRRALAGTYDHEAHVGVRHAAIYWHFLDLVWLFMYGTFLFVG